MNSTDHKQVSAYVFRSFLISPQWESTLMMVWFYGISTIVGYLMPNLLYTYILDINDLSLTIQLNISYLICFHS